MATRDGGGFDGFIQQFLQLRQVMTQVEQEQRAERQQQANLLTIYGNMAQKTANPETLAQLRTTFAEIARLPTGVFEEYGRQVSPDITAITSASARSGIGAMSPEERAAAEREAGTIALTGTRRGPLEQENFLSGMLRGEVPAGLPPDLAEAYALRLAAGQSRGEYRQDQALAGLPEDQQTAAARIAVGLQSSAPQERQFGIQDEGLLQGWATIRQNERELIQQGALGEAGLALEQLRIQAMGRSGESSVPAILDQYRKALEFLQTNKNGMSPGERQAALNYLNSVQAQLKQGGAINPSAPPLTIDQLDLNLWGPWR